MANYLNLADIDRDVAFNQMAGLQRDNLLQQMTRQKRQMSEEDALNAAISESLGDDGTLDENSVFNKLKGRGLGAKAYEIKSGIAASKLAQQKAMQDQQSNQLKLMVEKAKYGRDVMASVTPETWGQTRQQLIEQGFEFARNLPETYDPMAHKSSVMDADAFIKQQGGGSDQEYVYQNTSDGILKLGKKDGAKPELVINPATGKPFVASSASPELQALISMNKANSNNLSDLNFKPQIRRAESNVDLEMKPQIVTAEETAKAKVGQQTERTKNINTSNKFLSVAQQAKDLLDKNPTGSGIGAMADKAGRVVGISPESAQVASQLETVSGWLVANVPRMEGPQSNFDVENYKTMAGMIGDRTRPVSERKKALEAVMKLQEKYKSLNQDTKPTNTYVETRTLPDGRKIGKTKDGKLEIIK